MTNETLVNMQSLRADGKNGQFATEFGIVKTDAEGVASVPLNIAASLYSHPDFAILNPGDADTVKDYIDRKRDLPNDFEPGEHVRGRCRELAGAKACVCVTDDNGKDVNIEADFGIDGYAIMGINTAKAFKASLGDGFEFEEIATKESPKSQPKPDKTPDTEEAPAIAENSTPKEPEKPLTKAQQKAAAKKAEKEAKAAAKKAEKEAEQTAPVVDTEIPTSINVEDQ